MKIFISWSGERSHATAQALGPWIKKVIQSVDYWISSDMERGVNWLAEISKSLDSHTFGILCVTTDNTTSPWLCYEAGALSKHLGDSGRLIPYMLDFKSAGDLQPPLGQFNASLADANGTWDVIKTLNKHADYPQSESDLRETFELRWPALEKELAAAVAFKRDTKTKQRSVDDKLDEILQVVRTAASMRTIADIQIKPRKMQIGASRLLARSVDEILNDSDPDKLLTEHDRRFILAYVEANIQLSSTGYVVDQTTIRKLARDGLENLTRRKLSADSDPLGRGQTDIGG